MAGVEKEVEVDDSNLLRISGEMTRQEEDAEDMWHRVERRQGSS